MTGLVHALRPKSLERDGLESTLRDHVEALRRVHGAAIELRVKGTMSLSPNQELDLLRIAQEALHNAVRHAPGSRIKVLLEARPDQVQLTVRDDGPGFDPEALPKTQRTMGLATMRERAAALKARLEIASAPGQGADVTVRLSPRASALHA